MTQVQSKEMHWDVVNEQAKYAEEIRRRASRLGVTVKFSEGRIDLIVSARKAFVSFGAIPSVRVWGAENEPYMGVEYYRDTDTVDATFGYKTKAVTYLFVNAEFFLAMQYGRVYVTIGLDDDTKIEKHIEKHQG